MVIASSLLPDAHTVGAAAGAIVLRSRVGPTAGSAENITDWALAQFQSQYDAAGAGSNGPLTKDAIFHYVYAVLHDPAYRETYAQNLKREFPRIPFYDDFSRWADWGEALIKLHIGYESVEPWPLERFDAPDEKAKAAGLPPKTVLKADKDAGVIVIDSETQLTACRPRPGRTAWATAPRSNGFSTSTRRRRRRIRPSARSLTPTASPTT